MSETSEAPPAATPEPAPTRPAAAPAPPPAAPSEFKTLRVIVRPLPKAVFFYLTWIGSFVCAIVSGLASGDASPEGPLGLIWMGVFFFNLLTIAYDFNEERSLAFFLGIVATVLALLYFDVLGSVSDWFGGLRPMMNSTFYWMIFAGFTVVFFGIWLNSRLDYWEFRPNEVVHRYGIFPRMKRFSTEDMRWDKEIPDVLERILLGSGRIILTTPHEKHPIVIQHVVRIGKVDDQITDILGVKAVVQTR